MNYKILVIDDDEPIHFMVRSLLKEEFTILNAQNVQKAIDILSEKEVNLILSDIHMPGISGLEFLESIRLDEQKKKIPVLIMTNLPTVEKEQKAFDLGAADFIKKELLNTDKEKFREIIRMKIVTDIRVEGLDENQVKKKDRLVMKLMETAISGSFTETIQTLCDGLNEVVSSKYSGFWMIDDNKAEPIQINSIFTDEPEHQEDLTNKVFSYGGQGRISLDAMKSRWKIKPLAELAYSDATKSFTSGILFYTPDQYFSQGAGLEIQFRNPDTFDYITRLNTELMGKHERRDGVFFTGRMEFEHTFKNFWQFSVGTEVSTSKVYRSNRIFFTVSYFFPKALGN
jgi:CheY-like chemotaxis protein